MKNKRWWTSFLQIVQCPSLKFVLLLDCPSHAKRQCVRFVQLSVAKHNQYVVCSRQLHMYYPPLSEKRTLLLYQSAEIYYPVLKYSPVLSENWGLCCQSDHSAGKYYLRNTILFWNTAEKYSLVLSENWGLCCQSDHSALRYPTPPLPSHTWTVDTAHHIVLPCATLCFPYMDSAHHIVLRKTGVDPAGTKANVVCTSAHLDLTRMNQGGAPEPYTSNLAWETWSVRGGLYKQCFRHHCTQIIGLPLA